MTMEVAKLVVAIDVKGKDEFTVQDLIDMFKDHNEVIWRRKIPICTTDGEVIKYNDAKTYTWGESEEVNDTK